MRALVATIAATALTLLLAPAQASYVQDIYERSSSGQDLHVGTFELGGEVGAAPRNVIRADVMLAGVQFTVSDLQYGDWVIDPTSQLLTGWFSWTCPESNCIPDWDAIDDYGGYPELIGYGFWMQYKDGNWVYGDGGTYGCDFTVDPDACFNESYEVFEASRRTYVRPADAPTTILLLTPGLVGLLYRRKQRKG